MVCAGVYEESNSACTDTLHWYMFETSYGSRWKSISSTMKDNGSTMQWEHESMMAHFAVNRCIVKPLLFLEPVQLSLLLEASVRLGHQARDAID